MPPGLAIGMDCYGSCQKCLGTGFIIKKIAKFFPLYITRCPVCRGAGGIKQVFQDGEVKKLPYPRSKLKWGDRSSYI